ncbi:MAG TPA: gfo/Idh/MocA family oxidoreductase, partial [Clostridiales bacterium]|nr:gfo/Idh/MocA family oxidoreductase [Clostridiales bacterium]
GGVAFFEGKGGGSPSEIEARRWINSILDDTDPCVMPYQALTVTRILEAIYTSAKTGKPVCFDD